MNKEFKKTFFVCLLAVLLIVSNIVNQKYTSLFGVVVGVDFVTYPFTFLCTLLILNLGDKKDAYRGILVSSIIQLLICISYVLISSLAPQTFIEDNGTYISLVFKVNEMKILSSVLAFIISHCTLIYLYDNFKRIGKELTGLVISLLGAMVVDSIIFRVITLSNQEPLIVIDMLLANIIISIVMSVVITILFYILKDKEPQNVKITDIDTEVKDDLNALDLMKSRKTVCKKTTTKKVNHTKSYNRKTNNNSQNRNNNKKTNVKEKKSNNSKERVKK